MRTDFWSGAVVLFLSALGFVGYGRGIRRELRPARLATPAEQGPDAPGRRRGGAVVPTSAAPPHGQAAGGTEPSQAPPRADLDDVLVPIATALLSDLVQRGEQRGGQSGQSGEGGGG